MNLKGKRAIVTGATKGIGLAVAQALAERGVDLALTARTEKDVRHTVESLSESCKVRVRGTVCDVANPAQAEALIDFCSRELGGLEILINNAGLGVFKPVEQLSVEEWRRTIGVNLDGVFYCTHFALPLLKRNGGFIINISSLAGKNAFPGGAAYNASKFALTGFSEALMQEVRYDDIRVAYIMPGSVDTWFGGSPPEGGDSWKLSAQDVAEVVIDTLCRHPRCLTSRIEMRPSKPPRK